MTQTPTAEKAQAAASTAATEGRRVAGVAQGEAQRVAGEATAQIRDLVDQARTEVGGQLGEQTRHQRDNLVRTLGSLTDDLDRMADSTDGSSLAADLAHEVATRTKAVGSYLDGREPGQIVDDVRGLARRRPGAFLAGALVAGVVAGRLARGAKDADTTTSTTAAGAGGTSPLGPPDDVDPLSTPTTPPPVVPAPAPVFDDVTLEHAGLGTAAAGYGERSGQPGVL